MSLIQTIKDQQLILRKAHQTANAQTLTTLIGEAVMIGKNAGNRETTDEEVVSLVKKFVKNLDEVIKLTHEESIAHDKAVDEKAFLMQYLPKQLSDAELFIIIDQVKDEVRFSSIKDMGKVMKLLKERYSGQYDSSKATDIIKNSR